MVREVRDFSGPNVAPLQFTIDDDTFIALGEAPGQTVSELAELAGATINASHISIIMRFLDQVLTPDSAVLFSDRMRGYRLVTEDVECSVCEGLPLASGGTCATCGGDGFTTSAPHREALKPISFGQLLEIFQWLIEVYMESIGTPTQPRSSSQNGRGGTGRSSTAGARAKAGGLQTAASQGS